MKSPTDSSGAQVLASSVFQARDFVKGELDLADCAMRAERELHALLDMMHDGFSSQSGRRVDPIVMCDLLALGQRLLGESRAARNASREQLLAALAKARS